MILEYIFFIYGVILYVHGMQNKAKTIKFFRHTTAHGMSENIIRVITYDTFAMADIPPS